MTPQEELVLVNAAISDILKSGQTTSYQGRSLTMVDYQRLLDRKDVLESKVAAAAAGGRSRIINVTPIS